MLRVAGRGQSTLDLPRAFAVQQGVIADFNARAQRVLGPACKLRPPRPETLVRERHLFSTLFLAVQHRLGIPEELLPVCGLINHCMRAWVTACDNLLDDEDKVVLEFDLPAGGRKFVAVLTLMTADRVMADLLAEECQAGRIAPAAAAQISHESLRSLIPSGVQEHEEERGARVLLSAQEVLADIHLRKTGLLFEAPVVVASRLRELPPGAADSARLGLRTFGLGCQILDDLVDLLPDLATRRHNVIHSLLAPVESMPWGHQPMEPERLAEAQAEALARAAALFRESRAHLAEAEIEFDESSWRFYLAIIPSLLRVPEEHRARFADLL